MAKIEIPQKWIKWIMAYRTISEVEYEFFLRGLNVDKVLIRAEAMKKDGKYYGEIHYKINDSVGASMTVPASASFDSGKAIVRSLQEFLEFRTRQEAVIAKSN